MRVYSSGKRRIKNHSGEKQMTEQPLAKDPATAATTLAALEEKDTNEALCRYPTCRELRQATTKSGRPSAYCENPEHTPVSNHRARQYLKTLVAGGAPDGTTKREIPSAVGGVPVESLRNSVIGRITQLQSEMERYLVALTTIADPDLSAAQIRAALDQADARVAAAQQDVSVERSLRMAAETARMAAEAEARAEREAAEQAIGRMEEAEAKTLRLIEEMEQQREEAERRMAELQAEHADTIDRLHAKQEEMEQQARQAIAEDQEKTRQANIQAHEARVQAAAASGLVHEARATLDRERAE